MSTEVFLNEFAEISEHPYRILSQYKKEGKKVCLLYTSHSLMFVKSIITACVCK